MKIAFENGAALGFFAAMANNLDMLAPERVAPRLRAVREARTDKPKRDISTELGLSESALSKYETAAQRPSLRHFVMLADYYRVPIEYLILGETDRLPLELAKKMGLV